MKTTKIHRLSLAPRDQRRGPMLDGLQAVCVAFLFCLATAIASPAQTFTTLINFDGTNGEGPVSSLVQGFNGNLYGTTYEGGANDYGTVFEITPAGTLTTIHTFCTQANCSDGNRPQGGLVSDTNGNLYGTTSAGGGPNYFGTAFRITPKGTLTTLHTFCTTQSFCVDGGCPYAGLVQGTDGNFYGTTSGCGYPELSTVYKITPGGTLTTLYNFCYEMIVCTDGVFPYAGLVQGTDGNLYGTTWAGGTSGGAGADGTIFKITPWGRRTTLYNFCIQPSCFDGWHPWAGLVQATDGNFYGTTLDGGTSNYGTVFEITPAGALTTLHSFNSTDGLYPYSGLVQASDGNFYGTTYQGGAYNYGTVFEITPAGALTTLHSFDSTDGAYLYAGLMQATNGIIYGTTAGGGANGYGTVFSLSMGLAPFVETLPTAGKVGRKVIILGNNLNGATAVAFNGTAATYKIGSNSAITTTVPIGATTGAVTVTTPSGTLTTNVPFRVVP